MRIFGLRILAVGAASSFALAGCGQMFNLPATSPAAGSTLNSVTLSGDLNVDVGSGSDSKITLAVAGPKGEKLSYEIVSGPSHGTLSGEPPELTYTPHVGYVGSDSFKVRVSSPGVEPVVASISLRVYGPLAINAPSITLPRGSGYSYGFVPSGGVAPYSYQVLSGSGSVNSNGIYVAGATGSSALVRVTDSVGNHVDANVKLAHSLVNGTVNAQVVDSFGNTYLGGAFTTAFPYVAPRALAINTVNGNPDLSFDLQSGFNGTVRALVRDPISGAIYLGGDFTSYRGQRAQGIAKLSALGILDTSFNGDGSGFGGDLGWVNALALNSSGTSLYVGGNFSSYRGVANSARGVAKLSTSDGVLDTVFHPVSATGGFDGQVSSLALNAAGTVLYVGGNFYTYRGVPDSASGIAKLSTSDGAIDTNFYPISSSGGFLAEYNGVLALALNAAETSLYVGGWIYSYRGVANSANFIAKLSTSDGAIDTSFHPVSATGGFDSVVNCLALDSTGSSLYVGGSFYNYRGVANAARGIAKLSTSDGSIDTVFHPVSANGGFDTYVNSIALDATGKNLYVGGYFNSYRGVANSASLIAKLSTSDGSIDTTFHPVSAAGGFNSPYQGLSQVTALALDGAGNTLWVGGSFSGYRGLPAKRIAKFDSSGSLDLAFVGDGSGFDYDVKALAVDAAGANLYVGGYFLSYRGVANSAYHIAKLSTSNGAADTAFHPVSATGGFSSSVKTLALNSTGSTLYVGGSFSAYRGIANSARRIAKLSTSDGAIDTAFHPVSASGGFDSYPVALALNSSGSILYVGGPFTAYRGVANSARRIAKLSTSDGSIDTTFHPVSASGGFDDYVSALSLNSTGSTLYVGGNFTSYRGVANAGRKIAKLSTSDGAIDTTFHPVSSGGGFDSAVLTLALNSTGSALFVGGGFTAYRGVADSAHGIAKLATTDGAIDTTFHPVSTGGGFDFGVQSLAWDANGSTLYAGGWFSAYESEPSGYSCMLNPSSGNQISY